jgi:antitoxin CptB
MLELDVLLSNFVEKAYSSLSAEDQHIFQEMLKEPDPVLFEWLMGRVRPDDARFANMTDMIRNHARSRI